MYWADWAPGNTRFEPGDRSQCSCNSVNTQFPPNQQTAKTKFVWIPLANQEYLAYVNRTMKSRIFIFVQIVTRLFIVTMILGAFSIVHADPVDSSSLINKNPHYIVRSQTIRVVTAYNAGDPGQTDDTPCISANGENICKALAKGKKRCAANFVPLGSHLHVEKIGVCRVTDRTNKRYRNRVDIAMQRDEYHEARRFGRQKLTVKIIDIGQASH